MAKAEDSREHPGGAWQVRMAFFSQVSLKEVVIEPNVKLECVPKFCYLGDTLGAGGDAEEAASAEFKEISSNLTARGASYRIKWKNIGSLVPRVY